MSRGFVTIATGHNRYYKIARNLLRSYRQFASKRYPFAIICDRKNLYTDEFDQVILVEQASCNYLDKLRLYEYLPYDETIFIDADSLAYGDLDEWWNIFEKADDFSLFGYAWTELDSGKGWFVPKGLKEYRDKVTFILFFNGGIYYMRRSERCKEVFRLANYFASNYSNYQFNGFDSPADEPCLALAMAVQDCHPLDVLEGGLAFAPTKKQVDLDIVIPKAIYKRKENQIYRVNLIHWSNFKTKLALYRFEVEKLNCISRNRLTLGYGLYKILYQYKLRYYILHLYNLHAYLQRCLGKVRKMLKV